MHPLVAVLGLLLVFALFAELFVSLLLPRRVKRDPRIARQLYSIVWPLWRRLSRRMGGASGETALGLFGPLAFLAMLGIWILGLILGWGLVQWGLGSHLTPGRSVDFGDDLYFSAGSLFTIGAPGFAPHTTLERTAMVATTASGLGIVTIVIAYLPALFGAFSRRETAVSQLDPRAGSPPTAGRLLLRSTETGSWNDLAEYLREWETWAAELMETHLSYPVLAYYRSQHVNQNWLSALCTIMDTCAFTVAAAPRGQANPARFTFAIGRHALADLAYTFRGKPTPLTVDRLPEADFNQLLGGLAANDVEVRGDEDEIRARLTRMRELYEPHAAELAGALELTLPAWLAPERDSLNWRTTRGLH